MLRRSPFLVALLLSLLIANVTQFAFPFRGIPPYEQTAENAQNSGAPQAKEKAPDKITDWLLVLFNGLLFASTVLLWRANNRSAKIAERALTELEQPFISLEVTETGLRARWTTKDQCHVEQSWNSLTFVFVNYGRTAAVLLELQDKLQICEKDKMPTLEWPDDRRKIYPYGVLIGPDKPSAESFRLFDDFADKDEFMTFSYGDSDLFLVGRLKYRDIFSGIFELGFCAVFNRETNRFFMKGDEQYNYCHRAKN